MWRTLSVDYRQLLLILSRAFDLGSHPRLLDARPVHSETNAEQIQGENIPRASLVTLASEVFSQRQQRNCLLLQGASVVSHFITYPYFYIAP